MEKPIKEIWCLKKVVRRGGLRNGTGLEGRMKDGTMDNWSSSQGECGEDQCDGRGID